jgi:hypothetical protein
MNSQHLISQLISQNFDKAIRVVVGLRSAVGREWEFAYFVLDTLQRNKRRIINEQITEIVLSENYTEQGN